MSDRSGKVAATGLSAALLNNFRLEVIAGPYAGKTYTFDKAEITVGRGAENDLVLTDDPKMSRRHFKITMGTHFGQLENLSQKSQLYLNSNPVSQEKIKNESLIQAGDSVLKFLAEFSSYVVSEPVASKSVASKPVTPKPMTPRPETPKPETQLRNSPPSNLSAKNQNQQETSSQRINPQDSSAPNLHSQPPSNFNPAAHLVTNAGAPFKGEGALPPMAGGAFQSRMPVASTQQNPSYGIQQVPQALQSLPHNSPYGLQPSGLYGGIPAGAITSPYNSVAAPGNYTSAPSQSGGGRAKVYGVFIGLLALGYFAFFDSPVKKSASKRDPVRTEVMVARDVATVEKKLRDFEAESAGEQTDRIRRVKENLQRGLRDLQQGNYARAQESFQVVMNLDADNLLARRYYQVSKVRFDEQAKALMLQAKRYKEKYNFRMCAASYKSVENMLSQRKESEMLREAINGRKICQVCQERGSDLCRDSK